MLDTTIRPSDIDLYHPWSGDYFCEAPDQRAAGQVCLYLQQHGNTWSPFQYDDLDRWLTEQGHPNRDGVPRLGWLTDGLLRTDDNTIIPTLEFVTECFKAAGQLREDRGCPSLHATIDDAVHGFALATTQALVTRLERAGCLRVKILPPNHSGRVRATLNDVAGRPFTTELYLINANPADGELVPLLKARITWQNGALGNTWNDYPCQLPYPHDVTPASAADDLINYTKRLWKPARVALGLARS